MKFKHDIIKRPILTEKSYDHIAGKRYTFELDVNAHKTQIKQAIEEIFDVITVALLPESTEIVKILADL